MLVTGAAHALTIITVHTTFPSQPEPRPRPHHISGQNSPDSSPGLCLLHDYKVGLYFAELVLLLKNHWPQHHVQTLQACRWCPSCNCFCRLCCEFCPLYALIEQGPHRSCSSLQTLVTGLAVLGLSSLQASYSKSEGLQATVLGFGHSLEGLTELRSPMLVSTVLL